MVIDKNKAWELGDNLNIYFMNGTPHQKETLIQAIDEWTSDLDISFNVRSDAKSEIRVSFENLLFASIGKDALRVPLDLPTLQVSDLGNPKNLKKYAKHEFGHVLGCIHEHQSPKAPFNINQEYVLEKYRSMPYGWPTSLIKSNFFKMTGGNILASDYDADSIMIYGLSSKETHEEISLNYNNDLSATDKEFIHHFYSQLTL